MLIMFLFLIFSAVTLAVSDAEYADSTAPKVLEKASLNDNGFAYAFSGGWPDQVFPDNTFMGGAMPVGDFLQNLKKQQEHFESNIMNWASEASRSIPPLVSKHLGRDSEGAYAGAAIGPSGVYQTAQIFPENPNSPNIETRFASSNPSPDGNFFAVATSSQSGTQTIDGKTTGFRKASTTVNDNGKVTTFNTQNP